ncbi:hypothetical protein J2X38_002675 [Sphingopyxis sp. BE235]|nr:hypothetical protein [Sphingopyxis sp. BE235]MDR7179863.1 hypothetical protein [Sphingopyxis sp. BE249]
MHADIRNRSPGCDKQLTEFEGGGNADSLDHRVGAARIRHLHQRRRGVARAAVDRAGGAEPARDGEARLVQIDHDDPGGREELRREQRGKADRTRADDRDGRSRRDLAVEHAAFEARRQDVAEHDQRIRAGLLGDGIEARVGMRDTNIFCLRAVDDVAEDPAACRAMRWHAPTAIVAAAARRDAAD